MFCVVIKDRDTRCGENQDGTWYACHKLIKSTVCVYGGETDDLVVVSTLHFGGYVLLLHVGMALLLYILNALDTLCGYAGVPDQSCFFSRQRENDKGILLEK
jgi:hypothetical protein